MFELRHGRALLACFALLAASVLPTAAEAGTINIILSDMDVTYSGSTSGGSLFDLMGGFGGGVLDPVTADDITTAVFELDNTITETIIDGDPDSIHADLRITNIGPTIAKGPFHPTLGNNGGGFGFDLFVDPPGVAPPVALLRLGLDEVSLLLTNGVFFFTGEATVLSQNLPDGLAFVASQPVFISYTATLPAVNAANPNPSMAAGSGAFTISGIMVPEPAVAGMAVAGILCVGLLRRRR
jgi:hypothetical protein